MTGTPRLKIDMDPADWGEKWAAYESGSGTRTLIFAHTVVEPNLSTQGIAVLANTLALNGGTIRAGGADANLAHDGLAHDANHKVNWQTASELPPLTARFVDVPASHGGEDSTFSFGLVFSEALARQLSSATLRNRGAERNERNGDPHKAGSEGRQPTLDGDGAAGLGRGCHGVAPGDGGLRCGGRVVHAGRAGAVERGDGDGIKCGNGDRVARGAIGDGGVGGLEPDLGQHLHAGRDDPHSGNV